MTSFLTVGIRTGMIREGDDLVEALIEGILQTEAGHFADWRYRRRGRKCGGDQRGEGSPSLYGSPS